MEFGESIKTCFKKYVTFKGRASRSEFWWFYLFYYLLQNAIYIVLFALPLLGSFYNEIKGTEELAKPKLYVLEECLIYLLICIPLWIPLLSATVRRLHDTGHSGWQLLGPSALLLLMIILMFCGAGISKNIGFIMLAMCFIGPFIYGIIIFVWMLKISQPEENKYGPVPEGVYLKIQTDENENGNSSL